MLCLLKSHRLAKYENHTTLHTDLAECNQWRMPRSDKIWAPSQKKNAVCFSLPKLWIASNQLPLQLVLWMLSILRSMRMRSYGLCSREAPEVRPMSAAHSYNGYWAAAGYRWLRDASHPAGLSAALTRWLAVEDWMTPACPRKPMSSLHPHEIGIGDSYGWTGKSREYTEKGHADARDASEAVPRERAVQEDHRETCSWGKS